MSGGLVAVVEDDPEWAEVVERGLRQGGFSVSSYGSPQRFLRSLSSAVPDAAVIDMVLPGIAGYELVRLMRRDPRTSGVPLVAMTGTELSAARAVFGFEAGADEYLRKPFDPELLSIRLKGLLLRRAGRVPVPAAPPALRPDIKDGALSLSFERRELLVSGSPVATTRLEFELLASFLAAPGRVYTRRHLLEAFWPSKASIGSRSLDKHIQRLRSLLGKHSSRLEMVYGVGYVWRRAEGAR